MLHVPIKQNKHPFTIWTGSVRDTFMLIEHLFRSVLESAFWAVELTSPIMNLLSEIEMI